MRDFKSRMGINAQIALSMLCAAVLVTFLLGEYERRAETARLNADLLEQADLTVSLISGLMVESIIVQDTPVLETAMQEAIARNAKLQALKILEDDGTLIAEVVREGQVNQTATRQFQRNIVVEGETFGSMEVDWSTAQGQALIDANVTRTRFTIAATVFILSILFLLQTNILAMRPLRKIHDRMSAVISGKKVRAERLGSYVAREFEALDFSVSVLQDTFSERDEREHALELARVNADKASRAKSDFLANMSHEIRTPMNGVIGMAELMLETKLDEDQTVYAETISSSGSALLVIINDILNFSKIEAGKMELEIAPFDLEKALEDVVTLLSAKASEKNVEVTLRYDPNLPTIFEGDVGRVRQVITNIAGNAVKFTLEGYTYIDVTGQKGRDGYELKIEVTDTGIGIPPDQIGRIFSEFEQVDSSRNRKFEGTGLGLAISTRLIKAMGGEISARSEVGEGSTFTICLPLPESMGLPDQIDRPDIALSGLNVLVVDDLKLNRKILSERLRSWDVQVELASSGQEAVDILEQRGTPFDLVIEDYQMPGMDGEELARHIRASDIHGATPLIILSSVDQSVDVATKEDIGSCELLLKPVRSEQLRGTMARALRGAPADTAKETVTEVPDIVTGNLNVLVAEDNKTNRLIVKTMLKTAAVDLTFANDGRRAVETFAEMRPDLVLMDMSMPEMDGVEATQAIRQMEADRKLGHTPIIALTANAMRSDKNRCLAAGMDDFLAKPINKGDLLATIKEWGEASKSDALQDAV